MEMTLNVGAYKKTGLDWMPEVPEHWEIKRAKSLFQERSVKGFPREPLLAASQKQGVVLKEMLEQRSMEAIQNFETFKLVKRDDFVISLRSFEGGLELAYFQGIISPVYSIFYFRQEKEQSRDFFKYLFKSKMFIQELNIYKKGIRDGQSISFGEFANIYLPIPPLTEQAAIVQYIKAQEEKINLFIQKKQRFIELLKEQRQSKIDEAVDGTNKNWLNKKLKYIAEIKFSNVDKHTIEDEIPVRLCNYVDVYKNDYITNDLEFMTATATETEIEKFTVLKGDVIITKDSEEATDIAVPTFVKEDLENVVCGYHLALIRANENEILNEYLFRKFQSSELKAYFAIEATGVTRVGLSLGEITGVKISYPKSIEEQKQIVSHIKTETATIDTAIAKAEREIELIREYKEAMIAEAVMGKRGINNN